MSPWVFILMIVVCITVFIILMTLLSSAMIGRAARKHSQKAMDVNIRALEKMLPGKNCGACGCKTCAEYAKEVFICSMDPDKCVHGSEDLPQRMEAQVKLFLKDLEDNTPKKKEKDDEIW
jgi:Na+-translocating ferredoxin:NAD+ oxidoreductase RNF subunit RnfB